MPKPSNVIYITVEDRNVEIHEYSNEYYQLMMVDENTGKLINVLIPAARLHNLAIKLSKMAFPI